MGLLVSVHTLGGRGLGAAGGGDVNTEGLRLRFQIAVRAFRPARLATWPRDHQAALAGGSLQAVVQG